jgi:hypothetical protein
MISVNLCLSSGVRPPYMISASEIKVSGGTITKCLKSSIRTWGLHTDSKVGIGFYLETLGDIITYKRGDMILCVTFNEVDVRCGLLDREGCFGDTAERFPLLTTNEAET